jgi:hypothetical protein
MDVLSFSPPLNTRCKRITVFTTAMWIEISLDQVAGIKPGERQPILRSRLMSALGQTRTSADVSGTTASPRIAEHAGLA